MAEKNNTRERIILSAKTLFGKHGYSVVSMTDIANAVGITKASLYHFFASKQEIYLSVVQDILKQMSAIFAQSGKEDSSTTFAKTVEKVLEVGIGEGNIMAPLQRHRPAISKEFEEQLREVFLEFYDELVRFFQRFHVRNPEMAVHVLIGSVHKYLSCAKTERGKITPKQFSEYLEYLFRSNV